MTNPTDKRIYAVAAALYKSEKYTVSKLAELTKIDPWFLSKINNIVNMIKTLEHVDYKVSYIYSIILRTVHESYCDMAKYFTSISCHITLMKVIIAAFL